MIDISCYFYDKSQLTLHCLAEMALHSISLPRQHRSAYEIRPPALTFRGFLFWSKTLLLCPQYSVRDIYSDNINQDSAHWAGSTSADWQHRPVCPSLSLCHRCHCLCIATNIWKSAHWEPSSRLPSLELPLRQGWGKMLMILITWTRSPQHPPLSPQDWLLALPPGGHQAHQSSSHNCTTTTTCRKCAPYLQIY